MELEFDKEMNAILRKAGRGAGTAVAVSPHVDADTLAAFAENALPQRSRPPLIEHFAACDRCREMLAQTMVLNREADATAASSVVETVPAEVGVPWYRRLFSTPGLALAMGALVIAFTGLIGYIAMQNRGGSSMEVSQITEPEPARGGPFDSGESSASMTNTAANTAPVNDTSSAVASTGPANAPGTAGAVSNSMIGRSPDGEVRTAGADSSGGSFGSVRSQPASEAPADDSLAGAPAPPPPPVTTADASKAEDEKKRAEEPEKDADLFRNREMDDRGSRRDAPAAAAKSGPARSGPFQMKNQTNQAYEMSVTRNVGGKTFNNRNDAWYDAAYSGQATKDVRRGTDEFKKLDGGLRSIANKLGGVVVVVWNGKAYRIQ